MLVICEFNQMEAEVVGLRVLTNSYSVLYSAGCFTTMFTDVIYFHSLLVLSVRGHFSMYDIQAQLLSTCTVIMSFVLHVLFC